MGNHRAERRGPGRRPSDPSTPVVGKRRAEKPGRRSVSPVDAPATEAVTALRDDDDTLVLPLTRGVDAPEPAPQPATYVSSRIGGVRAAPAPRTGPSQPGARRSSSRAPLFRGLPSAP